MGMEQETTTDNIENSPAVALAKFVAGTITEGCGCDECLDRRELVTQLVMLRNQLNLRDLARAVDGEE